MRKTYMAITGPRDTAGRAPFTAFWLDTSGPWRTELSNTDHAPVGYRRSQCFRAVPEEYIERGAILVGSEQEAERLGHRHPDLDKPVRTLRCCCCDERTRGRQWHNRDTNYGICRPCVKYVRDLRTVDPKRGEDENGIRELYGLEGIHWNIEGELTFDDTHGEWVMRYRDPAGVTQEVMIGGADDETLDGLAFQIDGMVPHDVSTTITVRRAHGQPGQITVQDGRVTKVIAIH